MDDSRQMLARMARTSHRLLLVPILIGAAALWNHFITKALAVVPGMGPTVTLHITQSGFGLTSFRAGLMTGSNKAFEGLYRQ